MVLLLDGPPLSPEAAYSCMQPRRHHTLPSTPQGMAELHRCSRTATASTATADMNSGISAARSSAGAAHMQLEIVAVPIGGE